MASRKSASQVKVVKPKSDAERLRQLWEEFEATKDMYLETLKVQIKTARRVDNMLNIRDYMIKFRNDSHPMIEDIKFLLDVSVETYEKILERSKEFTVDEFMKPTLKDYYEGIVPDTATINTPAELEIAGIIFLSVQPYGQKMMQMHQYIQQCMDELGVERKEETKEEAPVVEYESEH